MQTIRATERERRTSLRYAECEPDHRLSPYIRCYWSLEWTPERRETLQRPFLSRGGFELIFNRGNPFTVVDGNHSGTTFRDAFFMGPMTRIKWGRTHGPCLLFGVCFQPGGAMPWVNGSAHEMTDCSVSVDDIWGLGSRCIVDRIRSEAMTLDTAAPALNRYFQDLFPGALRGQRLVDRAMEMIRKTNGRVSVEQMARKMGITRRHLERVFRRYAGPSPKMMCRIFRFSHFLHLLMGSLDRSWVSLSLKAGFFDQAHLIRDFRLFAGHSPDAFIRKQPDLFVP
jgi:AraC-like DNA-binding protein